MSIATQTVHAQFGMKMYCDMHFRNKVQILKSQRTVKTISEAVVELKNLVLEAKSKILLESAQAIKAVQLKARTDFEVLSKFFNNSKDQIELFESKALNLNDEFSTVLSGEPYFLNHFQELSKKLKVFENNFKSKSSLPHCWKPVEKKPDKKIVIPRYEGGAYQELNSDTTSLPVRIAPSKKNYESLVPETLTLPPRLASRNKVVYLIETKKGLVPVPNFIVTQIEEAVERNQSSVEIYNMGKKSNLIDLVNWMSYKINDNGELQSYHYKIHLQRT